MNNKENKSEDEIIISNTINQLEEEDLEKYLNKYQQYKEFFSENLDKKKFTSEVIQKILNESQILILNSNNSGKNFMGYYKNEEKDENLVYKGFNYDYMIYLRDRALTRAKINDSIFDKNNNDEFIENLKKEEKIILRNNQLFIENVHQINVLIKLMDKISRKGFIYYLEDSEMKKNNDKNDIVVNFGEIDKINNPLLLKIIIKIEKNGKESYKTQFLLNGEEYKSFNEIYETINRIYENIESIQRNAFSQKKYISFIYGKQFRLFLDYFLNKKMSEDLN
jgi:hypothetical protein